MPNTPEQSPLGRAAGSPGQYAPELLYPIPRAPKRQEIGIGAQPPFFGADLWTAYEMSWLTPRGKPVVAIAQVTVPCESPNIIESKSFKLYLNSFSDTRFGSADEVLGRLRADIAEAAWRGGGAGGSLGVRLLPADTFAGQQVRELDGVLLDRLDIECSHYTPEPSLLAAAFDEQPVQEVLTSNLLKSNCPVTGQPDWGSVQIRYSGPQIDQGGLLRYLVSYRHHDDFHEHCVERIFMDIRRHCRPTRLAVHARYTRRGGLDINPFRTSHPLALPPNVRTARQ